MKLRSRWMIAPPLAAVALVGGPAWWLLRPRPTLDGVARRIDSGQFRAAEGQLREYLATYPGDEQARIWLALVLVDRPEPVPEGALELVGDLRPADPGRAARARAVEGDAEFWAGRYDRAESAWLEALRIEPTIPEVGWKLLNIYAAQGRDEDSRQLGLRLFAVETDQRDRVQLLLQLIRHDAHPIEAGASVHELEPIVRANPADLRSTLALGRSLIRSGRADEGLDLLRRAAGSRVDDPRAQLAYLDGLVATGGLDELARVLEGLPRSMSDSTRFDAARGWLAAQRRDLDEAARAYRRALEARPSDPALAYRFKGVLRQSDRPAELEELSPRLDAVAKFPDSCRALFDRVSELPDLGMTTHPELYRELASLLGQVGRQEEADAWGLLARRYGRGTP